MNNGTDNRDLLTVGRSLSGNSLDFRRRSVTPDPNTRRKAPHHPRPRDTGAPVTARLNASTLGHSSGNGKESALQDQLQAALRELSQRSEEVTMAVGYGHKLYEQLKLLQEENQKLQEEVQDREERIHEGNLAYHQTLVNTHLLEDRLKQREDELRQISVASQQQQQNHQLQQLEPMQRRLQGLLSDIEEMRARLEEERNAPATDIDGAPIKPPHSEGMEAAKERLDADTETFIAEFNHMMSEFSPSPPVSVGSSRVRSRTHPNPPLIDSPHTVVVTRQRGNSSLPSLESELEGTPPMPPSPGTKQTIAAVPPLNLTKIGAGLGRKIPSGERGPADRRQGLRRVDSELSSCGQSTPSTDRSSASQNAGAVPPDGQTKTSPRRSPRVQAAHPVPRNCATRNAHPMVNGRSPHQISSPPPEWEDQVEPPGQDVLAPQLSGSPPMSAPSPPTILGKSPREYGSVSASMMGQEVRKEVELNLQGGSARSNRSENPQVLTPTQGIPKIPRLPLGNGSRTPTDRTPSPGARQPSSSGFSIPPKRNWQDDYQAMQSESDVEEIFAFHPKVAVPSLRLSDLPRGDGTPRRPRRSARGRPSTARMAGSERDTSGWVSRVTTNSSSMQTEDPIEDRGCVCGIM